MLPGFGALGFRVVGLRVWGTGVSWFSAPVVSEPPRLGLL